MNNSKLALADAALVAGLGWQPAAMADANHAAAYHRGPYVKTTEPRRHLTKKGPGRKGHRGKQKARGDRRYTYIAGKRLSLRKLIGTRG